MPSKPWEDKLLYKWVQYGNTFLKIRKSRREIEQDAKEKTRYNKRHPITKNYS